MIKVVSFDLDGTLEHGRFDRIFWDKLIIRNFAKNNNLSYKEAYRAVWEYYNEVGKYDMKWYDISYWIKKLNITLTKKQLIDAAKGSIKTFSETRPLLKRLKKYYALIITSNAIKEFLELKMRTTRIRKYFKRVYSCTSELKEVKSKKIFLKVLKDMKIKPAEMAHIGDDYDFDYLIPRKLGIKAFYLDRSRKRKGKHVVHSLEEFEKKLSRL
jgi:putative hydrolase of the HAD superfamily